MGKNIVCFDRLNWCRGIVGKFKWLLTNETVGDMTKPTGASLNHSRPRLFVYSLGFLFQHRIRRIIKAHGWQISVGLPLGQTDSVAVWGRRPVARRGIFVARHFKRPLITIEDAFLRSVLTGRQGGRPIGLLVDDIGIYFDMTRPNRLDALLKQATKLSGAELKLAEDQMTHMLRLKLSKYNDFTPPVSDLPDDFILVVDQTVDDASISMGDADAASFAQMLASAKLENPEKKVLIKAHPETMAGQRNGYFSQYDCDDQVGLITGKVSPADLFDQAAKVYCVTSQIGLEAIFAGHRPVIFGKPFYAGLGLSDDRKPDCDRGVALSPAQVFWATHLQYSNWYDPYFDRSADFLTAVDILHARARQCRDNEFRAVCLDMRLWKRGFLSKFLSAANRTSLFYDDAVAAVEAACIAEGRVLVWAGSETEELAKDCALRDVPLIRVEDGFLRSVGLGAKLVVPTSLAFDDSGIYYDPTRPSQLERIINRSNGLSDIDLSRARNIRNRIIALKMTKYNVAAASMKLPAIAGQKIILVPGQVEDDASILKGAGQIKTNLGLLRAVRKNFPAAYIVFKPHPDVEAGLRVGAVAIKEALKFADIVAADSNMADLLEQVDHVATITSLAGFEALLRGKSVTCYGSPFYSGWGLTSDKMRKISRREARPDIDALVHACLIEYPRYWDPVTGDPCPVEVILERFERGQMRMKTGTMVRVLAKLQGLFASYAHLWR
jgi:capsular polysaccharide export protein